MTLKPNPKVEVAWSGQLTGVFTVGRSTVGGSDAVGGAFGYNAFDDISADVHAIPLIERGRPGDLGPMQMGRCQIELVDDDGTYNPENGASSLAGYLVPMRPLRVRVPSYPALILRDKPLGYWRLDEASGSAAADLTGRANGTYSGPTLEGATGPIWDAAKCPSFDSSNDEVQLTIAEINTATDTYVTVEFWMYWDGADLEMPFGFTNYNLILWQSSFGFNTFNSDIYGMSSANLAGGWHHVVGIFHNGSTMANCKLYIDGAARSLSQLVATPIAGRTASSAARISGWPVDADYKFGGEIADLAVYNGEMAAATVAAHYRAGLAETDSYVGIFDGFIESIEHDSEARRSYITAVDLFERLATPKPTIAATGTTTVGAAIGLILDERGWTSPSKRALDDSHGIPDFEATGATASGQLITDLIAVDLGAFLMRGDGVAAYHSLNRRYRRQPVVASLPGTLVRQGARTGTSIRRVINKQTVTRTGGVAQTANDTASQDTNDTREGSAITSSYLNSDAQSLNLAEWLVSEGSEPRSPAREVALAARSQMSLAQIIAREVGDYVTAVVDRDDNTISGWLEHLRISVDRGRIYRAGYTVRKKSKVIWTVARSQVGGADVVGY